MVKNSTEYSQFLQAKHVRNKQCGFKIDPGELNAKAFEWQRLIVSWALQVGRAGVFEDCGLGKSFQELMFAEQCVKRTGKKALLLCPLAVQSQMVRECEKFGIGVEAKICREQSQVASGITITNYDRLHLFDPSEFDIVVLDESSILKNYTGAIKRKLCEAFKNTPYRLACTATPAPNDRMEIGNHSDFLGVMPSNEMLCRWFINAGDKVGLYRLRKHGENDFWRWMASWAMCLSSPADLGFDASAYKLPPLNIHEHVVEGKAGDGFLFNLPTAISATEVHREKRRYLNERAKEVAKLVNGNARPWVVWVDTDYEADAVRKLIPDAIEVRGSHSAEVKEERLSAFSDGKIRVMVTKSEIAGFGLNWQHCCDTTWFAGYSYERFYQAIRRLWRYGQLNPVNCHLIRTESEGSIMEVIKEKEKSHLEMQREVASLMGEAMKQELGLIRSLKRYQPSVKIQVPSFLGV